MSHNIFVSYSHADRAAADAVVAALETVGLTCWYAPRDILPGRDWPEEITRAIRASRVMLLLISRGATTSQQIQRELGIAAQRNLRILPVRLESVELSGTMEYYLTHAQWFDAPISLLDAHLHALRASVRALLGRTGEEEAAERDDSLRSGRGGRSRAGEPTAGAITAAPLSSSVMRPGAVFLSYAKEDLPAAERLGAALSNVVEVWPPNRLIAGDMYVKEFRHNVRNCSVFIPILSYHVAAHAGFYRREWAAAVERSQELYPQHPHARFLVPVIVDDLPRNALGLPSEFSELEVARLPGGEASAEFCHHIMELVRSYRVDAGKRRPPTLPQP